MNMAELLKTSIHQTKFINYQSTGTSPVYGLLIIWTGDELQTEPLTITQTLNTFPE